jgi:hypothetical protein
MEQDRRLQRPAAGEAPARQPAIMRPRVLGRTAFAIGGIAVFIFALQAVRAGSRDLLPILDALDVSGAANAVGFGWLFAYIVLSGSPVAAIGISLLSGGAFSEAEAFAVVGGSRLGASFIVLAVGFISYLQGRRSADGLGVGVVALLTTFTIQGPAILLGLVILHFGWLDNAQFDTPVAILNVIDESYGPLVRRLDSVLPGALMFVAGVAVLMASFWLFDRALPQLEGEADTIHNRFRVLDNRWVMFLIGAGVTTVTLSVSLSITVLVPLALKGYVRREQVIPYVMGANITTFIDTLFGAVVLGGASAFTVVLTEMVSVAALSLVVLLLVYRPYASGIVQAARWVTRRPRHLSVFLGAIVAVPAALLIV